MRYACKVLRYDTGRALIGPVIRVPDDTPRHRARIKTAGAVERLYVADTLADIEACQAAELTLADLAKQSPEQRAARLQKELTALRRYGMSGAGTARALGMSLGDTRAPAARVVARIIIARELIEKALDAARDTLPL